MTSRAKGRRRPARRRLDHSLGLPRCGPSMTWRLLSAISRLPRTATLPRRATWFLWTPSFALLFHLSPRW